MRLTLVLTALLLFNGLPAAPAEPANDRSPLVVGFLMVNGVYNTELTAPLDVFHHTVFHTQPGMRVLTVSPDGNPVTTFEGLKIAADHSFETAPHIDVLVVPSAEHSMDTDLENKALIDWVRATGRRARFVMSLCDGAFVLARAGLTDKTACTTFPTDQDRFAEMFPDVDLRRDVTYVHDTKVLTSQGGAQSFEAALYLVEHLYGRDVARGVARGLLVTWPPATNLPPGLVIESE